ncbi:MAG: ParB/RepB/Spo0J family partition protein [Pseudomonadota bacterium]
MAEAQAKKTLGRGLSALFDDVDVRGPTEAAVAPTSANMVPIDAIEPNADQPRKHFDETELSELADSIRQKGVLQPILVRPLSGAVGRFEIVAGERRWRAAQRANLHEVPVVKREMDDIEALEIAIIENVQRSDLNPIEEALGYRQLMDKYNYTQDALAQGVGKSRSHIANILRLNNLPPKVQQMVQQGELSAGHARAMLTANDPTSLAMTAVSKNWSVRDVEKAVKAGTTQKAAPSKKTVEKDADTVSLEGDLSAALRMQVSITHKGKQGGELKINYRSLEDLDELCTRLCRDEEAAPA